MLLIENFNFIDAVALLDQVNYFKAYYYFAKYGMLPVKMLRVLTTVADKKLGTTGISSPMGH